MSTIERTAWLAARKNCVGASEVAAVLGEDPYKSPYQLWAEKCGLAEPDDLSGNEFVKWGNRLQNVIAEGYAEETGRPIDPHDQKVFIPGPAPLGATPDYWQAEKGEQGFLDSILEIKAPGSRMASEWEDGAPLHYQIQLQAQLHVTGCEWGTIAALVDRKLVWKDYDYSATFCQAMMRKLAEFWQLVESRTPPPVDGSLSVAKVLYKLHPKDSGDEVPLPAEALIWDRQLRRAKEHIKKCESIVMLRENQLKAALGDCTFGVLPGAGRYSWKTQSRAGYTVEPGEMRVLRRHK